MVALLLVACGDNGSSDDDGSDSNDAGQDVDNASDGDDTEAVDESELGVAAASYDLAVGEDQRLMAGLFSQSRELLIHGDVTFQLGYLGEEAQGEADLREPVTASFMPVPGMEPPTESDEPMLVGGSDADGNGVYVTNVTFDQPGNWGLRVIAELEDGRQMEGSTIFTVGAEHGAPQVGDPAPETVNWTVADVEAGRVDPAALDSRAREGLTPDEHLHASTVADMVSEGRPAVVILSTPVFCVSRFCGPLVETLSDLAHEYGEQAEFIHIEIWENFQDSVLNEAAGPWIQTNDGEREPWVYLVDADGTISARWDNVIDRDGLVQELEALPAT